MNVYIKRLWYRLLGKNPATMPMVKYWKFKESVAAKIITAPDGSIVMQMEGEDYPFPSFPRGHLLFGRLSKLKHEIKNQVFNEAWALLEAGTPTTEVVRHIKDKLFGPVAELSQGLKYEQLPPHKMCPAVREIHRAWTKVAPEKTYTLRDYLCFILQEDDAYRFRVQWLTTWFGWMLKWTPIRSFDYALSMVEHGEVIGDMKERQRLLRRILMTALEDPTIKTLFIKLVKEINWNKVKLTEGDKYHFRGKYFKVDLDLFEY